jgi:hypothetical protein
MLLCEFPKYLIDARILWGGQEIDFLFYLKVMKPAISVMKHQE